MKVFQNFNWGHGLMLFFIFYIATLVFVLGKSMTQKHNLVMDDYYAHDIEYQETYNKTANAINKGKEVQVEYSLEEKKLIVIFNDLLTKKGEIILYNPADKFKDRVLPFEISKGREVSLPVNYITSGRWKVKINWDSEGDAFYIEKELFITAT